MELSIQGVRLLFRNQSKRSTINKTSCSRNCRLTTDEETNLNSLYFSGFNLPCEQRSASLWTGPKSFWSLSQELSQAVEIKSPSLEAGSQGKWLYICVIISRFSRLIFRLWSCWALTKMFMASAEYIRKKKLRALPFAERCLGSKHRNCNFHSRP